MHDIDTLIFSPHIDDEVLGCYSWLKTGTLVVVAGVEDRPNIPKTTRIAELKASSERLGFAWQLLDNTVNEYQSSSLITPYETAINQHKPLRVLIPEPSYNQDHRAVYDASIVATRPHDTNWFVNEILVFEQPHSVMWRHAPQPEANYFVELNIDDKLAAYALYASQVRGHRSPTTIAAMAQLRGAQINASHAEAFYAKRLVHAIN
ncbi:MAG: PIG-L family deacetylase [Granulosicoccaceae bacterium]